MTDPAGAKLITVKIPYPPSVNGIRLPGQGRLISTAKYRTWLESAAWEIAAQKPGKVHGPYKVTLALTPSSRHAADLDNRIKGAVDALVKSGVTPDDHLLQDVRAYWTGEPWIIGGRCIATVEAMT